MSDDREREGTEKRRREMQENYNRELLKLFEKAQTENQHLEKENSFHTAKNGRRDLAVHLAVTVLPRVNGRTVVGEKDLELNQYCFEIPAGKQPFPLSNLKRAFWELCSHGYKEVMKAGGAREG